MSIDDKDYVFARFKSGKPAPANQREILTIPGRTGTTGTRSVEVVRIRSGAMLPNRTRGRSTPSRGASWDGVFAAKPGAKSA